MDYVFLHEHWFDLLQMPLILVNFYIGIKAFRAEGRARKLGHLLSLQQSRQAISQQLSHPDLERILKKDIDLDAHPITSQEFNLVKQTISHLFVVYTAAKEKHIPLPEGTEEDIRQYFSYPIPRAVWEKVKGYQEYKFFIYISNILCH